MIRLAGMFQYDSARENEKRIIAEQQSQQGY
jgi:hypothetical protein